MARRKAQKSLWLVPCGTRAPRGAPITASFGSGPRFSPVCRASTRRPSLQPAPGRDSVVVPGGAPTPPECLVATRPAGAAPRPASRRLMIAPLSGRGGCIISEIWETVIMRGQRLPQGPLSPCGSRASRPAREARRLAARVRGDSLLFRRASGAHPSPRAKWRACSPARGEREFAAPLRQERLPQGSTFSGGFAPGGLIDRMKAMIFQSWSALLMVAPIGGIGACTVP